MRLNIFQKGLAIYLGALLVFWLSLALSGLQTNFWNYFYSFAFSLIPLIGGLIGMFFAKSWGWLKSSIGRAVFFISLGSFSWGAGSMVWSYYNFFTGVAAPYPSIADIGFVLALPFWIIGIFNLSKATGARTGLHSKAGKMMLFIIPAIVTAVSYYLLVHVARGGILTIPDETLNAFLNNLKLILDLAYPLGDVAILTLSLVIFSLSAKFIGGFYRLPILSVFLGFTLMYFADFVFSYTTTVGTFYNGNFGDLLFTLALFVITFGGLGLKVEHEKIEVKP